MKINPFPLLLILTIGISCHNENETLPTKGEVQFSLSKKERSGGRIEGTPTPAAVFLSMTDVQNNSIVQNKKLPLFLFGSGYVSESLQLPTGHYKLTQFMVLDANDKVIYATPIEGSELAQYVNDPLPIEFNITKDGSTLVTPQVLLITENDPPEIFGYVSFGFNISTASGRVKKVIFQERSPQGLTDTISFHYFQDKVKAVDWKFKYYLDDTLCYENYETRSYNADGLLESLDGRWRNLYEYKSGLRYQIQTLLDTTALGGSHVHYSTTRFILYNGMNPTAIETIYGAGFYGGAAYFTKLEFDSAGNLVYQKTTNASTLATVSEKKFTYGNKINPIKGLLEIPVYQLFGNYEDFCFYYSKNLPTSIEANYPFAYPNTYKTFYQYTYDTLGRVTHVDALKDPGLTTPRYTLDFTYE